MNMGRAIYKIVVTLLISSSLVLSFGQEPINVPSEWILPHEIDQNSSIDYTQMMNFLEKLSSESAYIKMHVMGESDGGNTIFYLIIADATFENGKKARESGKSILWINNGIHPGEPEGMDATLALIRDYHLTGELSNFVKDWVMIMVPVYNVDGMLNRGSYSRANQNGPLAYGFRANASNLDLNRDFIKCKSKEAAAFNRLYSLWKPDIFLDNHTSNGADYQHVMTLLPSEYNKLGGAKGAFFKEKLQPYLYREMEANGYPMSPYVISPGGDPKKGITAFKDSPRYSTGYASLHGGIAMMTETHMLKPFIERLKSNYIFMDILIRFAINHQTDIAGLHKTHQEHWQTIQSYPLLWEKQNKTSDSVLFNGYNVSNRLSEVTGASLREYNRKEPWTAYIPYFSSYVPKKEIKVPSYYVIPGQYKEVVDRLLWNDITVYKIIADTIIEVEEYIVSSWEPAKDLFEGQPYNYDVSFDSRIVTFQLAKGQYLVPTNQNGIRYILETLEPEADDSFFRWNFFDPILQRKEYFSDYVFEPTAQKLLNEDARLRELFEAKLQSDIEFANSPYRRLEFIYLHSPYAEPGYKVYPIKRLWHEPDDKYIQITE